MSRAEMTRTKDPRTVNTTVSWRPWSVRPKAAYRGSRWECAESGATMKGRLKNRPSASPRVTWCKSQFLSAFPESHSNPTQRRSSSGNPFTSCILLPYTLPASFAWTPPLSATCPGGVGPREAGAARAVGGLTPCAREPAPRLAWTQPHVREAPRHAGGDPCRTGS
jgi:hypothetical protein